MMCVCARLGLQCVTGSLTAMGWSATSSLARRPGRHGCNRLLLLLAAHCRRAACCRWVCLLQMQRWLVQKNEVQAFVQAGTDYAERTDAASECRPLLGLGRLGQLQLLLSHAGRIHGAGPSESRHWAVVGGSSTPLWAPWLA